MTRQTLLAAALALGLAPVSGARAQWDGRELTAVETVEAIRAGRLKSADLVESLLAAAEAKRGLNAFVTLDAPGARAAARAADARGEGGGPLNGLPIVVKDNIAAAGLPLTAGTPALKGFVPRTDAPVLKILREAGAVILGKTNMHELAFGITSDNGAFGAVGNAYAPTLFAGGSSGGTGAAIGARLAAAGLGTDTGGSVRIPAALNGVVGFRPTVGRYPGDGIVPISHTRDTAGPLARTVEDIVLLDGVVTNTTETLPTILLSGIRLGVPKEFDENLDPEVRRVIDAAYAKLKEAGATLVPVDAAAIMALNAKVGFPVALWEAGRDIPAFLAGNEVGVDLRAVAAGIASPDVRFVFDELILGAKATPEQAYREALDVHRPALRRAYADIFASAGGIAALIFPTTPLPARPIAGTTAEVELDGRKVPTFPTYIRNTDPGSNAGLPGLSVPAGLTAQGLPVGIEIDGPEGQDRALLALGLALEQLLGRLPPPAR